MTLIFKGFLIGIGKIIPGVSGAMIAMSLGMYEEIIEKLSNIKKDYKNSIKYLLKPSIGIIFAIIIMSKIIVKCLNKYYFPTMLLFAGMITGGIINSIKKTKLKTKNLAIIISFLIIIIALKKSILNTNNHAINYNINEFINLIGIGIIDAASSIIPGISGTAILMTLGYYNIVLNSISTLLEINNIEKNMFTLIPFGIGFLIGIILISKLINIILKRYQTTANTIITMFMILTLIKLLKSILFVKQTIIIYLIGTTLFIFGICISIKIKK